MLMELGIILAMTSETEQAAQKWCRIQGQTIILHSEGKPSQKPHKICEKLLESKASIYVDEPDLDDCYEFLRNCPSRD